MADAMIDWNEEISEDLVTRDFSKLTTYSRDWTVETIVNQITQGNIDLDPEFQRRNAWTDEKRSLLIESLIIGIPVPEIVLAENKKEKGKFLVLDGKQRLLAISGFVSPERESWDNPKLKGLKIKPDLNGLNFLDIQTFRENSAALTNADVRCTILGNYVDDDVLYNIFYRLNTGSVPLSTQELRQVLAKGPLSRFLINATNDHHPIQQYLDITEPDPRFRDVELLLRFIGLQLFSTRYRGNLKKFLDLALINSNQSWLELEDDINELNGSLPATTKLLNQMLGDCKHVGRKFIDGKWEGRFNKSLFDVEIFYASHLQGMKFPKGKVKSFENAFTKFCAENVPFLRSIEVTTKSLEQYHTRFGEYEKLINRHFALRLNYAKLIGSQE